MDNGEVIPGLNESWTLGGAKLSEWIAGFMMFIIVSELFFAGSTGRNMPILMAVWMFSTFGLAGLRRAFPDEERGIRNCVMTALGFAPPKTPTPAALQPYWSAAPVRELNPESEYVHLGLDDLFGDHSDNDEKVEGV